MTVEQQRALVYMFRSGHPAFRRRYPLGSLGAPVTTSSRVVGGVNAAVTGAAAAANPNLATTSRIGSGIMAAGGIVASIPGGQIPGAIIAAVGTLTTLIGGLFKPDLTKIEATHIVDQVEAQVLRPTLASWNGLPADKKTESMQALYLQTVDKALNDVQQGCSNPQLGTAGQHCISERLIHGGSAPWCPTGTGCDWITLYRDPIANDPAVQPDPPPEDSVASAARSFFGGDPNAPGPKISPKLLLGGALLFAAFALGD